MKYQHDIVTLGAVTRDVFLRSRQMKILQDASFSTGEAECFALGSKIDIEDIVFDIGGGGANTAVGFARQKYKVGFIGRIGHADTRGQAIVQALKHSKVDTKLLHKDRRKMTGYSSILLTHRGERTVLVYRGASADFSSRDIEWSKMRTPWVYASSVAGNLGILRRLWQEAQRRQIKIAWNPGAGELAHGLKQLQPLLKQVEIVMLNQDEATRLTQVALDQTHQAFDRLRQVVGGTVVITLGTEGSLAGNRKEMWHAGTRAVRVIDTTGAGDAFGCGFVGAWMRQPGDYRTALRFASANAEATVTKIGAQTGLLSALKGQKLVPVKRLQR